MEVRLGQKYIVLDGVWIALKLGFLYPFSNFVYMSRAKTSEYISERYWCMRFCIGLIKLCRTDMGPVYRKQCMPFQ